MSKVGGGGPTTTQHVVVGVALIIAIFLAWMALKEVFGWETHYPTLIYVVAVWTVHDLWKEWGKPDGSN